MLRQPPTGDGRAPGDGVAPRWRVARTVRPARVTRRLGRAPATLAVIALLLLAAVGIKATLAPRATSSPPPARAATAGVRDITEQGFAQAFARAYLSWDARHPDQHQRQVAAFLSDALDGDGGLQMPPRGQQRVLWSAAIQDQTDAHGDRVITVAAQTTRQLLTWPCPCTGRRRGFLVVPRYPALVGPPVSDPGAPPAEERDVSDGALRAVAERAVDELPRRPADQPARRPRSRRRRLAPHGAPRRPLGALDHEGGARPGGRRGQPPRTTPASSGRCATS